MTQSVVMRYFLFLLSVGLFNCSHVNSEIYFRGLGEITQKKIPNKCWSMPADEAALLIANEFKKESETIKVEKIKPLRSGYITFSGSSSAGGSSNSLIRFGEKPVQYKVEFRRGDKGFSTMAYKKNMTYLSCSKSNVSKETMHASEIAQYFRGMTKSVERDDFAISRDSISSSHVAYDSVQIYGSYGKRILWQEDRPETYDFLRDNHSWISDYAEVVLMKSQEFKTTSLTMVSNEASQRDDLVLMVREILQDESMPTEFILTVVKGVNAACLSELKKDMSDLSNRVPAVSAYVKRYEELEAAKKNRAILERVNSRTKADKEYDNLFMRLYRDKDQLLRREIDLAMRALSAVGDEARIAKMIDMDEDVEHLIYDMSFKNGEAGDRLSLRKLAKVATAYDHSRLIKGMLKRGRAEVLVKYLEGVNDKKFSQCSPHMVSEIRELRPEWKLKLQAGMIRYVRENNDAGLWTQSAIEELMPEDNPRYFDLKVVGECLTDPVIKRKIINGDYFKNPDNYDELLAKWQKLQ